MTRVRFTPEAEEHALHAGVSWRVHARTNPDLFAEELQLAQDRAARMKDAYAVYRWVRGVAVRRVFMSRAHHHLYYVYDRDTDAVWVVAVWGSNREEGPPLDNV